MGLGSTIQNRKEAKEWQTKYEVSAPAVGKAAPDFELTDITGETQVRLSSFYGRRPVGLIFGSFT
jgi:hypothetical protein